MRYINPRLIDSTSSHAAEDVVKPCWPSLRSVWKCVSVILSHVTKLYCLVTETHWC